jgi:DNA primase
MAKSYLEIVKYMVEAKFNIDGVVDKPDIIGAVFGQTEGILGNDLDLRELQKNGKIGRIEISLQQTSNKSFGKLFLPASLDRIETCILAAAVESVDRVGPYEATFAIEKVEDTRSEKRRKILERAKELVRNLLNTGMPDSRELSELVQTEVRASEITSYGADNLPAGPDLAKSDDIIIVEGRADVLNLLRNDITNSVAIGGAISNVPKSLISLAAEKEVTVFVDGDRGGDMILRTIMNYIDVDFVARAPDGKEVEDLARKEIIKALRTKIPIDQYAGGRYQRKQHETAAPQERREPRPQSPAAVSEEPRQLPKRQPETREEPAESAEEPREIEKIEPVELEKHKHETIMDKPALEGMVLSQLASGLDELSGTLRSRLYDRVGNVVKEVPIRSLLAELQDSDNVHAVVLDGVITQRLIELSGQKGVRAIYGVRANPITKKDGSMILYTKEQGRIDSQ